MELESVEAWLRQHSSGSGLEVEPESDEKITATYYDAEDWRFYRAGYALRVRKAGSVAEATMKSLSPAEGNLRRRREITELAAGTLQELGTTTGGSRVPRDAAFTTGVYSERYLREAAGPRSEVLRSKPFRGLSRGKSWKDFEKVMKNAGKSPEKTKETKKSAR